MTWQQKYEMVGEKIDSFKLELAQALDAEDFESATAALSHIRSMLTDLFIQTGFVPSPGVNSMATDTSQLEKLESLDIEDFIKNMDIR